MIEPTSDLEFLQAIYDRKFVPSELVTAGAFAEEMDITKPRAYQLLANVEPCGVVSRTAFYRRCDVPGEEARLSKADLIEELRAARQEVRELARLRDELEQAHQLRAADSEYA